MHLENVSSSRLVIVMTGTYVPLIFRASSNFSNLRGYVGLLVGGSKVPRRNKGASFRSLKFQRTRSQNSRSRRKIFETRPDIFENFMNAA